MASAETRVAAAKQIRGCSSEVIVNLAGMLAQRVRMVNCQQS